MRSRLVLLVATVLAVSAAFGQAAPRSGVKILKTGDAFHGDEVDARTGERWLGLAGNGAGFKWRDYKLQVRPANDPVLDSEDQKTGKAVLVAGPEPVFLVRGLDYLKNRKVTGVFQLKEPQDFPDGDEYKLSLGLRRYRLRVLNRPKDGHYDESITSLLVIEAEGQSQVLYEWKGGLVDQACELIWAGDLDGDGKLDVVMNLSDHYNKSELTLFLSAGAKGTLLKRITSFSTTGC